MAREKRAKVAVVGPCVSGKSELVGALRAAGYEARHVAQEHSYVPFMWERISRPDLLIYLDVDYPTAKARRPRISWGPERLEEQATRLAHARKHCDLFLDTTSLSVDEVREQALALLARWEEQQARKRGVEERSTQESAE